MAKKKTPGFKWAVPEDLGIPPDKLRARLDFYHQAVTLSVYDQEVSATRVVSAMDVAHALANDLAFGTGLLPPGTIWWRNTRGGPVYAIYVEPKIWKVALEIDIKAVPRRFNLPLPGLVFLCSPGKAPWVYAVKKKPVKETDDVYNAPLCNIHESGLSCAGTHKYPTRVADTVQSFFTSFFTASANLKNRSKQYPNNVVRLWESLDNKKKFPADDLVRIGNLKDLMNMEMEGMNGMVGYLVNYPDGISGEKGVYYNYILAANGLFIEASNPMLAARVPVSECEVRGLAPVKAKIALTYGSIPQHFFDLALDTFLAVPDREHYVAVTASAGYDFYVPVQDKGDASVVYEVGDSVVLDIHSHAHMLAFFSHQTDDKDETGLKLYAVVGRLNAVPVVKLRVGVYGYFHSLAWRDVFDGSLIGAVESEEEEVKIAGDLHGITEPHAPELQHHSSWLRWDRFFRR